MNTKAVKAYLSVKANRNAMIKKIEQGFKHQDIEVTKDPEVEQFQKGFLENWSNLENFPPAAKDLQGLNEEEKKQKKKELKNQFCEWISGQDAISEGYAYGYNKKEDIKESVAGAGRSAKSKVQAAMRSVIGDKKKIGRNDPCSCGSGVKYKKCCGDPAKDE